MSETHALLVEFTLLAKVGGPLTKRISVAPNGRMQSDGSACVMSKGSARRVNFTLADFASLIEALSSNEAITLGALRDDLPESVRVGTKAALNELNGEAPGNFIARTSDFISYRPGLAALALIDIDVKGLPPAVRQRIEDLGGYWPALLSVLPGLQAAGHVVRKSTSTGTYRQDTGERLQGSGGLHAFVVVADGTDVVRFLACFHDRCWLAGLGWMMVGADGQMLRRSLVDRMVGQPERLVFEGAPDVVPPLAQDPAGRVPEVVEGPPLDTREVCPDLTVVELARLRDLEAAEQRRVAPAADIARAAFVKAQGDRIAARTGCSPDEAQRAAERQCAGTLLPAIALPFDDAQFAGATVGDVLADPARFVGATLADPLEGPDYGWTKAIIMQRRDGSLWIHSFAHGRTLYELRHDAASVEAAVLGADPAAAADVLVKLAAQADTNRTEDDHLRGLAAKRAKVTSRAITARIKGVRSEVAERQANEDWQQRQAAHTDRRIRLPAPASDAPWLPQMASLNEVLGGSTEAEPPVRDVEGCLAYARERRVPNMHMLTADGANSEEEGTSRLPAAQQVLLTRYTEPQVAELIEKYIEHVDPQTGQPVHLAKPFVEHYRERFDGLLPTVATLSTLPLVLDDGTLLANQGLDRDRGIIFRISPALLAALPTREQCDAVVVREAYRFLCEEFLVDVATDSIGKSILIALGLTLIERALLSDRPVFFVSAARRGGGKTTLLMMLMLAVTGVRPAAAAWSPNDEERRKAILAYLLEGVASIIWDNIPRGAQISCPHIERSCTAEFLSDRRLGVSERVVVSASTVHTFTGNNIGPRGDMASRTLRVELQVDRPDPENRPFRNPDPIGWTEAHRGRILGAFYTILLGNPALCPGSNIELKTRFKGWWRLVGSAVEHAAGLYAEDTRERVASLVMDPPQTMPVGVDFRGLFLEQEEEEEDGADLASALVALDGIWLGQDFTAAAVALVLNDQGNQNIHKERAAVAREFLFPEPDARPDLVVTPKAVAKRLKKHLGEPVRAGGRVLSLRMRPKPPGKPDATAIYHVRVANGGEPPPEPD